MTLSFSGMPSDLAAAYRAGQPDANGQVPEQHVSDGSGVPCRHCLGYVAAGGPYLILSYRPFPAPQPYAEAGPIFLHAKACPAYSPAQGRPQRLAAGGDVIVRGYAANDRIVYGTGTVVGPLEVEGAAEAIFASDEVAYCHVRSATNNCFALRVDRAG